MVSKNFNKEILELHPNLKIIKSKHSHFTTFQFNEKHQKSKKVIPFKDTVIKPKHKVKDRSEPPLLTAPDLPLKKEEKYLTFSRTKKSA